MLRGREGTTEMRAKLVAALALSMVAACDTVKQMTAAVSPPQPHRCEVCGGTGSVTKSYQAPLPFKVVSCELERTGFLGLGSGRSATIGVQNNGDVGGTFHVDIMGLYPGGGRVDNGDADLYVATMSPPTRPPRRAFDSKRSLECKASSARESRR